MLLISPSVRRGGLVLLVGLFVAAALPAAATAAPSKWRSYSDTQHIPLEPDAAASILQVRTPPEDAPNDADVQDCMSQPGADTERGHVRSRFLWCTRSLTHLLQAGRGETRIHYQIMGYGRDDGQRNMRLFFRVTSVEVVAGTPPPPSTIVRFGLECEDDDQDCFTSGSVSQTLLEWDLSRPEDWWPFDVTSRETGPSEGENVAFHNVRLRARAQGANNDLVIPLQRIRCDSAEYFQVFGVRRPAACIFHNVVPYITYSIGDPRVSEVAGHIWLAQRLPNVTFPLHSESAPKSIPGRYPGPSGGPGGLTRIRRGATTRANRREVRRACNRLPPYEQSGLPTPPAAGQHCDEYPFASTLEGAASGTWDFSVQAVDATQNCAAGGLLNYYLTTDRILYNQDKYFVRIETGDPPPPSPPIFDPPNDGDDCNPDDEEAPTSTP